MKLPNYISIVLLATCSMIAPSCKKWLDIQPSTQLTRTELFKNEEGFGLALAGVYAGLSDKNLYGRSLSYGTLDAMTGYYSTASYARRHVSDSYKDAIWTNMYKQVADLNSLLEVIDEKKDVFAGDNYRIIKGEAIGLRAFIHLDILRMYGPAFVVDPSKKCIPFVDTLTTYVTPLSTVTEAGNRIIRELQQALSLMENDPIKTGQSPSTVLAPPTAVAGLAVYHNRRYGFNYYAVKATLARAYQWIGDKENALKYAKEVIAEQQSRFPWVLDNNLSSIEFANRANKDRTFTTEHIFALNIRALETAVPLDLSSASSSTTTLFYCTQEVKNMIYEFNSVDPRNKYLFTTYYDKYLFPTKLYQDESTSPWFKFQMPLIRISEMYYIAAECEPDMMQGTDWINVVRRARKLRNLTDDDIWGPEDLVWELQKEYEKEFFCEGQLWYFYKRHNYPEIPYLPVNVSKFPYVFGLPADEVSYGGRSGQ